jgi:hybrid cluster-associated redox disulfide protein
MPQLAHSIFAAAQGQLRMARLALPARLGVPAMRNTVMIELTLAEIMFRWPATMRIFIDRNMHCIGCPIAPFHTLVEAAEEHGQLLDDLLAEIELAARGDPARGRRQ